MRRFLPLLLALTILLLSACGAKTQTYGDLRIQLPGEFVDLSGESFAADFDFLYQGQGVAVAGIRESRLAVETAYGPLDAQKYAALSMKLHGIAGEPSLKDGIWHFSYSALSNTQQVTYLCAVYETAENLWLVQAYCPAEHYDADTMWQYVCSVDLRN